MSRRFERAGIVKRFYLAEMDQSAKTNELGAGIGRFNVSMGNMKKINSFAAIGGWIILAAAVAFAQDEKAGKPTFHRSKPISSDERIMMIHSGYLGALEDLSQTETRDVKAKDADGNTITIKMPAKFGLKRQPTLMVLHNRVLRDTNVPLMGGSPNYTITYYAVSKKGKPLAPGDMILHKDVGPYSVGLNPTQSKEVVDFANQALPELATADLYRGKIEGLEAQARPLRMTRHECMSCHSGSKVGDPLAIMVYLVKRAKS